MKNDGTRDLQISVAWALRDLQKLRAVNASEAQELFFWFVRDSKEKNAPPLDDQRLAFKYLEEQKVLMIERQIHRNSSYDLVADPESFGIQPDGYAVTLHQKSFDRICGHLQALIERLSIYVVRAEMDFDELAKPRLHFIENQKEISVLYRTEKFSLKLGSRYYALIKVLFDYGGTNPLTAQKLITEINKYIVAGKPLSLDKQLFDAVDAIKKGLKAEKDDFFPIKRTQKTIHLFQK